MSASSITSAAAAPLPNPAELLDQLDKLDYPDRRRYVDRLAYAHRNDPNLDALLDSLEQGQGDDPYCRGIAIQAALVAKRRSTTDRLLRAITSDSVFLRKMSASPLGRTADVATLQDLLPHLPPKSRRELLSGVVCAHRTAVADVLLPFVRGAIGNRDAAKLLSICSPDVVREHLPDMRHVVPSWKRLARRQDAIVLDDVRKRIEDATDDGMGGGGEQLLTIWSQVGDALDILVARHPDAVAKLASRTLAVGVLPYGIEHRIGKLAKYAPLEVGELLTHPGYRSNLLRNGLPRSLTSPSGQKRLRSIPQEFLVELASILIESSKVHHLTRLLGALAPSARGEIFERACRRIDTTQRVWSTDMLDVLPHRVRNAEARRILDLPAARSFSSEKRLELKSYCDIVDARDDLEVAARRSKAEERREGYSLLISCTGRYRRGFSETLRFVSSRAKNDQDSVREGIVDGLADLSLMLFADDDLEILRELLEDALKARDVSWGTRNSVQRLTRRLLEGYSRDLDSSQFQLGLHMVQQVVKHSGQLDIFPRFGNLLSQEGADAIYSAIDPMLEIFAENADKDQLIVSFAQCLGDRAWLIDALQYELEGVATNSSNYYWADAAATCWLGDPKTRDERIRRLLDKDPSCICFDTVSRHLCQKRQIWLDPYLADEIGVNGRFKDAGGPYNNRRILPVQFGFELCLLLPRQQKAYRHTLRKIIDSKRPTFLRAWAVRLLAMLPIVGIDNLGTVLHSEVEEVSVFEAALAGLAWIDRPVDALPILLDHLDGDRARVAMYALSRLSNLMEPEKTFRVLEELLSRGRLKITVEKEIIRLLGGLGTVESVTMLANLWKGRKTFHRDVKVAFCHAACQCIDREEAYEILVGIADDEEAAVARSILHHTKLPEKCLSDVARKRSVGLILRVAEQSDAEVRRDAFRTLANWVFGSENEIVDASARAITKLEDTVSWGGAQLAFISAIRSGKCDGALNELVRSLRAAEVTPAQNAGEEYDLPARRRLLEICNRLHGLGEADRIRLRTSLQKVANELEKDGTLWHPAIKLRLSVINFDDSSNVGTFFADVAAAVHLPWRIHQLTQLVGAALQRDESRWQPKDAENWLSSLDAIGDGNASVALRHVELAIVMSAARRTGWISPWVDRLRILRDHPDLGLRTAALDINTCAAIN